MSWTRSLIRGQAPSEPPRHDRRPVARPVLTSRDAHAHKVDAVFGELGDASLGVAVQRVPAVHDDVATVEHREQRVDLILDRLASGDQEQDLPRPSEACHKLFQRVCADHLGAGRLAGKKLVDALRGSIEHGDAVPVVVHVEDEVPSHHAEPDEADVCLVCHER